MSVVNQKQKQLAPASPRFRGRLKWAVLSVD